MWQTLNATKVDRPPQSGVFSSESSVHNLAPGKRNTLSKENHNLEDQP